MEFRFSKWSKPDSDYERVYVNAKYLKDLNMYFDTWTGEESRLHFNEHFEDFPHPFCMEENPALAVRDAALEENGIDPNCYTWEELLEACR
jgi:hypothetical protein